MKIIGFFVHRPVASLMIYLVLALLGVVSFLRMPVDLMPGSDSGVLTIFVGVRGGLPPEDIESLITKPVEDEMATLLNLDSIMSVSRKERAVITLNFKVGTDTSRAALEVQERLAKIKGKLPKEIEKPVVSRYDESQSPIMILAMSSKHFTPEEMRDIADNRLKPILKRVDGVANVEIGGGRERKILVEFDQARLEAYALPIRQVIGQIGADNLNLLSGKVEEAREAYFVRTVGAFQTLEDLGNLPIAVTKEGSRLRLKDVAEIKDFYLEPESYSRMNREPVVSAYIQKEALSNTITTGKQIKRVVADFKKDLDPRITLTTVLDQSIAIEKALKNVWSSLYEGALLAGLILILFLRDFLTSSFIFVSIPLTIVMTFAVMHLGGFGLNVMTISGLAIAAGMIVDDSIVVLVNIIHRRRHVSHSINRLRQSRSISEEAVSEKVLYAAKVVPVEATEEMLLALVASTVTTVIVFLPIVFLNPQVKALYSGLAVTVSASLLLSLVVSVTVIPSLASNSSIAWAKQSSYWSSFVWLSVGRKLKLALARVMRWFLLARKKARKFIQKRVKKIRLDDDLVLSADVRPDYLGAASGFRAYRRLVGKLMRRRYWLGLFLLGMLLGCGWIYRHLDKEFVGTTEENEFTIFVELPSGAKLDVSDKVVGAVEKVLSETPDVQKSVKTSVARVEGWSSKIYVTLSPRAERTRSTQETIDFLRPLVSQIGQEYSAFVYFSEPTSSNEFVIDVYGYDYGQLRDLAVQIAQLVEKVPGMADIKLRYKPGRPELKVAVDREKATMFDLSVQEVAESLHAQVRGLRATYFLTPTAQVETVARLQESYRKTLEDVQLLSIVNPRGLIVPIRQFASFEFGLTPSEVWRKDRERMIQVSANRGDTALSKVADGVTEALKALKVPTGYYYEFGGDYPKMVEAGKESQFAFFLMVILVYVVLASLFESYSQPLVILTAVPFALIGAIPFLYVTKTPLTLGAMIGLIMLGGIAVKNSIILMDVFNHLRRNKSTLRSLLQAGQERVKPILMTSLTAILGLMPFLFGREESGSLWTPLAVCVVGGLSFSTVLVLFALPACYLIMEDIRAWILRRFGRS